MVISRAIVFLYATVCEVGRSRSPDRRANASIHPGSHEKRGWAGEQTPWPAHRTWTRLKNQSRVATRGSRPQITLANAQTEPLRQAIGGSPRSIHGKAAGNGQGAATRLPNRPKQRLADHKTKKAREHRHKVSPPHGRPPTGADPFVAPDVTASHDKRLGATSDDTQTPWRAPAWQTQPVNTSKINKAQTKQAPRFSKSLRRDRQPPGRRPKRPGKNSKNTSEPQPTARTTQPRRGATYRTAKHS